MIGLLILIVLISLFCNGIYLLFNFGNVLDPARLWIIDKLGGINMSDGRVMFRNDNNFKYKCSFFYKPLFGCITCMSSIWGSIAYFTLTFLTPQPIVLYPVIIICCSCMNLLINRLYE